MFYSMIRCAASDDSSSASAVRPALAKNRTLASAVSKQDLNRRFGLRRFFDAPRNHANIAVFTGSAAYTYLSVVLHGGEAACVCDTLPYPIASANRPSALERAPHHFTDRTLDYWHA